MKNLFFVYVIGLDLSVLENKKFLKKNPQYIDGMPCVYVGQSAHTPDVRFAQHREGYKSSSFPKKFGLYLRNKLFEKVNPLASREEALVAEEQLAKKLIRRGYGVWWN
jgi:hypothetical protein